MDDVLNYADSPIDGFTYADAFQFTGGSSATFLPHLPTAPPPLGHRRRCPAHPRCAADAPQCSTRITPTVNEALLTEFVEYEASLEPDSDPDALEISAACAANLALYTCQLLRGDHIIEETVGSATTPLASDCIRDIEDSIEASESINTTVYELIDCVPAGADLTPSEVEAAKTCLAGPISALAESIEGFSCMSDHPVIAKIASACFTDEDAGALRGLFAEAATQAEFLVQASAGIPSSELSAYLSSEATTFKEAVTAESRSVLGSTGLGAASVAGYAATVAVCAIVGVIAAGLN